MEFFSEDGLGLIGLMQRLPEHFFGEVRLKYKDGHVYMVEKEEQMLVPATVGRTGCCDQQAQPDHGDKTVQGINHKDGGTRVPGRGANPRRG